ncbi:MAG: VOC family protein [Pyrinomonadaceae bacterium]
MERKTVHTRHVLAVKNLVTSSDYFVDKLGFERDFTAPGWEFLSFGDFKVMLGECVDALWAHETGDHSYFAHCLVENVDEVYEELKGRGAVIIHRIGDKPWGLREFSVKTPDGHRITFGQVIGQLAT